MSWKRGGGWGLAAATLQGTARVTSYLRSAGCRWKDGGTAKSAAVGGGGSSQAQLRRQAKVARSPAHLMSDAMRVLVVSSAATARTDTARRRWGRAVVGAARACARAGGQQQPWSPTSAQPTFCASVHPSGFVPRITIEARQRLKHRHACDLHSMLHAYRRAASLDGHGAGAHMGHSGGGEGGCHCLRKCNADRCARAEARTAKSYRPLYLLNVAPPQRGQHAEQQFSLTSGTSPAFCNRASKVSLNSRPNRHRTVGLTPCSLQHRRP